MGLKNGCRETMESPMSPTFGRHAEKTLCQLITASHGLFINIFVYFSDYPKFEQRILFRRCAFFMIFRGTRVHFLASIYSKLFFFLRRVN